MKPFGVPLIYVVIAVGVLGVVTLSYYQFNAKAFAQDDTLKCQRTYDFSQVKFTPEAKADWEKCYMGNETYYRWYDEIRCSLLPEDSCDACASELAAKYNDTRYCELPVACGFPKEDVANCVKAVKGLPFKVKVQAARSNFTALFDRLNAVFPARKRDIYTELPNGLWVVKRVS